MTVLKQRGGTRNTLQDSRRVKAGGPGAGDGSRQREQQAVAVCPRGGRDVKPRAMLSDGCGARDSTSSRLAEETSILQQPGALGLSQANMRPTRNQK